jgi:hypothetical protein
MYDENSQTVIYGIEGDKKNGVLTVAAGSSTGTITEGTHLAKDLATTRTTMSGGGSVVANATMVVGGYVVNASNTVTSLTISNPGVGYTAGDTLTVTGLVGGGSATFTVSTVGDTLGGIPVESMNKHFSSIVNYGIDSFACKPDLTSYNLDYTNAVESTIGGGEDAYATTNMYYDVLHTMIPSLTYADTTMLSSVRRTGTNSPESKLLDTTYTMRSTNDFITLNDNNYFERPSIISSSINEKNVQSGGPTSKSFECRLQFNTANQNLSPVIDVGTIGALGIMNRINDIDLPGDLPTAMPYIDSTEPDGDNNAMVYVTRKVNLKNPATVLKVLADNFRPPESDLKFMFKILKNDETTPIDDLGFEYFNTTGGPDIVTEQDARNFKEYEYTAEGLPEFTGFVVKIVGQSSNTSIVPLVTALRCIALA